eukprot:2438660-Alexandrium_andersonii.AAC.1
MAGLRAHAARPGQLGRRDDPTRSGSRHLSPTSQWVNTLVQLRGAFWASLVRLVADAWGASLVEASSTKCSKEAVVRKRGS